MYMPVESGKLDVYCFLRSSPFYVVRLHPLVFTMYFKNKPASALSDLLVCALILFVLEISRYSKHLHRDRIVAGPTSAKRRKKKRQRNTLEDFLAFTALVVLL